MFTSVITLRFNFKKKKSRKKFGKGDFIFFHYNFIGLINKSIKLLLYNSYI